MDEERLQKLLQEKLRSPLRRETDRYLIRFLLDEQGAPRPINDLTTAALQGVGTLGRLEVLAEKGDERAAAFVTRLSGYLDQLFNPITANHPLTADEQAVYDAFRREISHAAAYYHLLGCPQPVKGATPESPTLPSREVRAERYRRIIQDALATRHDETK